MFDLEQVIDGCKRGKRQMQVKLYEQYAGLLLGICMRYTEDKSEAEDVLQEGFLKIFEHIKEYQGKGSFEGWMRKIMVNTAITHFHKHKKHYYHSELDDVHENELQVDITPDSEIAVQELQALLQEMPEGYKMVFNLFAVEGYKHKEIAEQLNIDENTSKSQYLRAKNWLIKRMKNLNWVDER